MSAPIIYQIENHIATITLNRPETLNALDEKMGLAFRDILKKTERNRDVRVAVITGAGRAFSSGGSLEMIEGMVNRNRTNRTNTKQKLRKFYSFFLGVRKLSVPVIAAINGHAVGAGLCLALACDLRYAANTAKLGVTFAKMGLAPGAGATYLITKLAGPLRASEILLLGENLSGDRAFEMGLLNGVFEPDTLMHHVHGVAHIIAENGPFAVKMIKKGIQLSQEKTLKKMLDFDAEAQAKSFAMEDIKEGILAIKEKRTPRFVNK